jgi:dienelactone hydrolase
VGVRGLTVDSLGPRGIASGCGGGFRDQPFDAYAALSYLSQLDFVDPARVAVLGQSMGGAAVLYAADRDLVAQYFDEHFRAAIAYYPGCGIPAALMTAPTLVLIGEADDWNPAERCREMVKHARPDGAPITLTVYPGATHAFDVAEFKSGIPRSATGSNTTSPQPKMRSRSCMPSSPRIWGYLRRSRPNGDIGQHDIDNPGMSTSAKFLK